MWVLFLNVAEGVINICEEYAAEYDVLVNGAKSQFRIFKGQDTSRVKI